MNTTTQRPTPETDAFWSDTWPVAAIVFARNLERERDEARESKDRISKRAEAIRCELVEKDKQLEAMREAIKETAATLENYLTLFSWPNLDAPGIKEAVIKLQPLLKP